MKPCQRWGVKITTRPLFAQGLKRRDPLHHHHPGRQWGLRMCLVCLYLLEYHIFWRVYDVEHAHANAHTHTHVYVQYRQRSLRTKAGCQCWHAVILLDVNRRRFICSWFEYLGGSAAIFFCLLLLRIRIVSGTVCAGGKEQRSMSRRVLMASCIRGSWTIR